MTRQERRALERDVKKAGFDPKHFRIEPFLQECNARRVIYAEPGLEEMLLGHIVTVHGKEWLNILQVKHENGKAQGRTATIPIPDDCHELAVANFMAIATKCHDTISGKVFAGAMEMSEGQRRMLFHRVPGMLATVAQYDEWK